MAEKTIAPVAATSYMKAGSNEMEGFFAKNLKTVPLFRLKETGAMEIAQFAVEKYSGMTATSIAILLGDIALPYSNGLRDVGRVSNLFRNREVYTALNKRTDSASSEISKSLGLIAGKSGENSLAISTLATLEPYSDKIAVALSKQFAEAASMRLPEFKGLYNLIDVFGNATVMRVLAGCEDSIAVIFVQHLSGLSMSLSKKTPEEKIGILAGLLRNVPGMHSYKSDSLASVVEAAELLGSPEVAGALAKYGSDTKKAVADYIAYSIYDHPKRDLLKLANVIGNGLFVEKFTENVSESAHLQFWLPRKASKIIAETPELTEDLVAARSIQLAQKER